MKRLLLALPMLLIAWSGAEAQNSASNMTYAVTVGTTPAVASLGHVRQYLAFLNQSNSVFIACAPTGITPTINGAGSITMAPLGGYVWDSGTIPSDTFSCIAGSAATPLTVQER